MRNGATVQVAGETLASMVVLPDFYERRGYQLAWVETQLRSELLDALRASVGDGLEPRDYHVAALEKLADEPRSPEIDADLDMLATDGVIRLAYHLRFGKVDVATIDPDWNFDLNIEAAISEPPALVLQEMIEKRSFAAGLDDLRPSHWMYAALRRALATYRDIESAGGWRSLPEGPTLRPGTSDTRLPALRQRLAVEGDLRAQPGDSI
ncbi:MAG TPA: hypothetical protein VFD07_05380, partial [Candidatus Krumholzibacteria bacterium]|nr:hypothetical protein [Candidatus Krumholzibacteria bacterium]